MPGAVRRSFATPHSTGTSPFALLAPARPEGPSRPGQASPDDLMVRHLHRVIQSDILLLCVSGSLRRDRDVPHGKRLADLPSLGRRPAQPGIATKVKDLWPTRRCRRTHPSASKSSLSRRLSNLGDEFILCSWQTYLDSSPFSVRHSAQHAESLDNFSNLEPPRTDSVRVIQTHAPGSPSGVQRRNRHDYVSLTAMALIST